MSEILKDPRKIICISLYPHGGDNEGSVYTVTQGSRRNCERIEVYAEDEEFLEGPQIPWLKVWENGEVLARVIASSCHIVYAAKEQEG